MSDSLLEVRNVSLQFNVDPVRGWTFRDVFTDWAKDPIRRSRRERTKLKVLNNVSFEVRTGERVGLIGLNGVGKTTLCRCIAGIYRPSSGAIRAPSDIRAVFSTAVGIQPDLTGRENAKLLSHFIFPHEPDTGKLVEEALDFSELGKFLDMPYRTYSNGMQTRLTLSLISAKPAALFILDEVFEGADQFFREKISKRMLDVLHQSGAALFVSHSADQIRRVCTRLVILDAGRIGFDGAVEDGLRFYDRNQSQTASNS